MIQFGTSSSYAAHDKHSLCYVVYVNQNAPSKKKRKQKQERKEAMPPGTMKVDIERDYVEQAHTNITKLEEFNRQIFELKLKVIEGNVVASTPMHALLHERMGQLQKQVDKLVQVGNGIERDEWSVKRARVSNKLSD